MHGLPERVGRYQVLRELGRGGMGVVFLGRDPVDGSQVALKVLTDLLDSEAQARFRVETAALQGLRHPRIVPLRETGLTARGEPFLVLELCPGGTLEERVRTRGPLPPAEVARLGRELALALAYAHERGLVHRDVKPANVLFDAQGAPRLGDFGVARSLLVEGERLTQQGALLGTPAWMAPEQIRGEAEPRSDLYGLGATLFYALSGRPPFEAPGGMVALLESALREPAPSPRSGVAWLDLAILRCLEKDPSRRFASGRDLAVALVAPAAPGWTRRVAAGALLLLALGGAGWWGWRGEAGAPEPAPAPVSGPPAAVPSAAPAPELVDLGGLAAQPRGPAEAEALLTQVDAALLGTGDPNRRLALLVRRGHLLNSLGRAREAQELVDALSRELEWRDLDFLRLDTLVALGRAEEAVALCDRLLARGGPVELLGQLHLHHGFLLRLLRRDDQAEVTLRRGLEVAPDAPSSPQLRYLLATLRLKRGDRAGAEAQLELLRERDPEEVHVDLLRADLALAAGDPQGALEAADRVLARWPLHGMALEARLAALMQLRRFEEALPCAEQLLVGGPSATRLLTRADLRWRLGDPEGARADVERAAALEPGHPGLPILRRKLETAPPPR